MIQTSDLLADRALTRVIQVTGHKKAWNLVLPEDSAPRKNGNLGDAKIDERIEAPKKTQAQHMQSHIQLCRCGRCSQIGSHS